MKYSAIPTLKETQILKSKIERHLKTSERISNPVADPMPIGSKVLQGANAIVPPFPFDLEGQNEWMDREIEYIEEEIEEPVVKKRTRSK